MSETTPEQPTAVPPETVPTLDPTEHGNIDWGADTPAEDDTTESTENGEDAPAADPGSLEPVEEQAQPHSEDDATQGDDESVDTGDPDADPSPADGVEPQA